MGCEHETNFYIISDNCAGWRICRRTVNIVPIWLYQGGGRIYGYCRQFLPHRIHIRRHGNQLFGIKPIWFVYNVCTNRCQLYGRIRYIRIYVRMPVGITMSFRTFVIAGGAARPWQSSFVIASKAKQSSHYKLICVSKCVFMDCHAICDGSQ